MNQSSKLFVVAAALVGFAANMVTPSSGLAIVLLEEDFEGLPLGPAVDETFSGAPPPTPDVWSPTGPPGWTVDNSQLPAGGTVEWRGWNWVDPVWWASIAPGQGRENFFGTGLVAMIADSDEWDDDIHDPGSYNTFASTPTINISSSAANSLSLVFDSSWMDEGEQTANITASFNGGAPVEVLRWESTEFLDPPTNSVPNPDFKNDANPEFGVTVPLPNPAGTTSVKFNFGYTMANNNWWWGVDNIALMRGATELYFEDFEGVDLGENVDEGLNDEFPPPDPCCLWTDTPPAGWSIDDSGIETLDDDTRGVEEWEGWSFANKVFWTVVAGDQNRSFFSLGANTVAVADPDEWDDKGDPDQAGTYETFLEAAPISLEGVAANSVEVAFDSSWRPECCDDGDIPNDQTATITVSYDGGPPIEILRWDSTPGDFFHPDSENESVLLSLNNPAGASSMVLTFGLTLAQNDWWWAIDNLVVSGDEDTGALTGDLDCDGDVDFDDIDDFVLGLNDPAAYQAMFGVPPSLKGDTDDDGDMDFDDIPGFVAILSGSSATAVPEPSSVGLALLGCLGLAGVGLRRRLRARA